MINKPEYIERKVIARPGDYTPLEGFEIKGTFNAGAVKKKNELGEREDWLAIRVAQAPIQDSKKYIKLPYFEIPNKDNPQNLKVAFDTYPRTEVEENEKDVKLPDGTYRMKHLSLPMLLRLSAQGEVIERQTHPLICPAYEYERFGMEDFRIIDMNLSSLEKIINNSKNWIKKKLGYGQSLQGNYVLTYVIPHREEGVSTPFIITKDFKNFQRLPEGNTPRPQIVGIKDVIPFPEKVKFPHKTESIRNNQKVYGGFIRPNAFSEVSFPGIWIAYSSDGIIWGNPHRLTKSSNGEITGSGTPPIKVRNKKGEDCLLAAYHETTQIAEGKNSYVTKLMEIDAKHPWEYFKKSKTLTTRADYRKLLPGDGYVEDVVFANGLTEHKGITNVYEGVGDTWQTRSTFYTEDLIKFVEKQ